MQQLLPRVGLIETVLALLGESPIVTLLGARQVGKTTLARMIAGRRGGAEFFDLEDPSARRALETTPELTLRDCRGLVVIDEVQRMPELFGLLRHLCDDPDRKASFLLLGSASPDLVRGVSETLAGRSLFLPVSGFTLQEVGTDRIDRLWLRGGFPRAFLASTPGAASRWLQAFRRTLVERDLPGLGLRIAPAALDRFWNLLAHYHGQVWNASEVGRALGSSPGTADRYRDLLAGTFMIRILRPWHENLGKRQVKSPKVYLRDTGLLHNLLGVEDMLSLRAHPRYGASWEGFALEQVLSRFGEEDAYFWSTQRGAELDLLLIRRGRRYGFEFKCADAPGTTKSMRIALSDLDLERLWVLYPGRRSYTLDERIEALPLSKLDRVAEQVV